MNTNLVELVDPPMWADNFEQDESGFLPRLKQMGGRRTTKSKKSKSKKSKSKKSKSKKVKKSKRNTY